MARPAVRIPYLGPGGELLAVRFRIALEGDRFRWKSGSKPQLYGLNRLGEARDAGHVVLVEGESDVHTFWHHGIPALGIPGAANWREDRDAHHFDGIEKIYVVIEPDRGGEAVRKWVSQSAIRHRVLLVTLPLKDASALHLESESDFKARWQVACLGAVPWTAHEQAESAEERSEAWSQCADLAQSDSILELLDHELTKLGVVGERRGAKLLYLAVTSRLLDRPVSVAVKGPRVRRQVLCHGISSEAVSAVRLLCAYGDVRPRSGLFQRTAQAPASRHLRSGGHGRRVRDLLDPVAAVRGAAPVRNGRKDEGRARRRR